MKVIFSCLFVTGLLFLLMGCGIKEKSIESIISLDTQTTENSSSSATDGQSIFKGDIESITESIDDTIQIKVVEVKAVEDPENIGTSFYSDGVILNTTDEQLTGGKEVFHKGDSVEFTLTKNSVMMMSIPPQLPAKSITEVTVVK